MAVTFAKEGLAIGAPHDGTLSYATRDLPEGATQTFVEGAPVVITAGLVVQAADPVTAINGIATAAADNVATGGISKVCSLTPRDREIYATLLGAADADHVLVAADLGADVGIALAAGAGPGGSDIWTAQIGGTGASVSSFQGDQVPKDRTDSRAQVGDTNARVLIIVDADILDTAT